MQLIDLLDAPHSPASRGTFESGLLLECQILDSIVQHTHRRAGILLDTRQAIELRTGNVAVLILDDVQSFAWMTASRPLDLTSWNVVAAKNDHSERVELVVHTEPASILTCSASSLSLHVVSMSGLPDAPPNYVHDSIEMVRAGMPDWCRDGDILETLRFPPLHGIDVAPR
jgi:hypothetical protein